MTTSHLTLKQLLKIKSLIVNTNNHLNKVFPSFNSLNKELSFSFHLVDTFSDYFYFYSVDRKDTDAKLHIITNLIISTRTLSLIKTQFLSFWILVLKTMLPLWSHPFIIQCLLKLNSLLLGVISISTYLSIYISYTLFPCPIILEVSLVKTISFWNCPSSDK